MAGQAVGNAYVEVTPKLGKVEGEANLKSAGGKGGDQYGEGFGAAAKGKISAMTVAMGNLISDAVKMGVDAVKDVMGDAISATSDYEQLAGGAQKIFDEMDYSKIRDDAVSAYKDLNMSANEYLESINQVGATFAQTMGDSKGYDVARSGMMAISNYATGTGRSIDELNEKYAMITRASSSYQSIADQFSGILPATSKDFLEQATAAGYLQEGYENLTDVPVAEYQEAVTKMLEQGVDALGLTGNTAAEAADSMEGSMLAMKSSWQNWLTALGSDDMDLSAMTSNLIESVSNVAGNFLPKITQIFDTLGTELPQLFNGIVPKVLPELGSMLQSIGTTLLSLATQTLPSIMGQIGDMAAQALSDSMGDIGSGVESLMGVGTEMVGMIVDGLTAALPLLATLASTIADSLAASMPEASAMIAAKAPQLVTAIANALVTAGPSILSAGVVMLTSLAQAVPAIIPSVISGILSLAVMLANTLMANVPTLFNSALAMFRGIALAVVSALPTIITTLGSIVLAFAQFLIANGPTMMASAGQMFGEIGHALIDVAPQIATALWNFICQLPQIVMDGIGMMTEAAGNFFGGFVDGIMGKGGDAQSAASDVTQGAVQAATENADASEAGQNIADSITAAMDFSAIETDATSQMESITANVAAAADGTPIAQNLATTSTAAVDTGAMDAPAQTMVQNAITAANSVDASSIGQQFSQSAAAGVDTSAMANQLSSMGSVVGELNQTATIKVEADLAGVQQLRSAASAVQGTFRAMSSAVQASMSNASRSAANAGASIRASMNIPSKTVHINVAAGSVVLPHFHMNGTFNPKTGAVPSVGVSWYAKGGIFDDPTIIGVGEKGPEAVVPIDKLADMLRLDDLSNQRPVYNVTINGVSGPDETARAVVRALRMSTV